MPSINHFQKRSLLIEQLNAEKKAGKTKKENIVCKVKGFSLNYIAGKNVNFESLKKMIVSELNQNTRINVEQSVINRNRKNWNIFSGIVSKVYSHVYDKRIVQDDLTTLPYGYVL